MDIGIYTGQLKAPDSLEVVLEKGEGRDDT